MEHLSKKEQRKERLRQERETTVQDLEKKERNKKMMMWVGSAFILGGVIALLVWLTLQEGWVSGEIVPANVEEDHWQGNAQATVSLVEYGDFQCGHCKTAYEALKPIKEEYGDRVLFIYRHFPILGSSSDLAARATEAAALQNKDAFWQMHDLLFENQQGESSWVGENAEQTIVEYAEQIGLDVEQFKNDLNSGAVKSAVKEDERSGQSGDVTGTPSFFLNNQGVQISLNAAAFREALDNALQGEDATEQTEPDQQEQTTQETSDPQEEQTEQPEDSDQQTEPTSDSTTQE